MLFFYLVRPFLDLSINIHILYFADSLHFNFGFSIVIKRQNWQIQLISLFYLIL